MTLLTVMMAVLKGWVLLFCFATMRYECRVFRIEWQVARLETIAETRNSKVALDLIPIVRSKKIPTRPVFYNWVSIAYALDPGHDTQTYQSRYQ